MLRLGLRYALLTNGTMTQEIGSAPTATRIGNSTTMADAVETSVR
jgi:hypothetical protein